MKILLIVYLLLVGSFLVAQTIELHSITYTRQYDSSEFWNAQIGQTLDGTMMRESREKLLNVANFGPDGSYPKKINITSGYGLEGSLKEVTSLPANDIFFFGSFYSIAQTTETFTPGEIDSLYIWSKRGGKLIIAQDLFGVLNPKWGFRMNGTTAGYLVSDFNSYKNDFFNGVFGSVATLKQAGSVQGYFNKRLNSIVFATDYDDRPTLVMDCMTLDLSIADINIYTSNPGGISSGPEIKNDYDRFFANTIAFMDKLQSPPALVKTGEQLSVGTDYLNYTWYQNGEILKDQNGYEFTPNVAGNYQVEVKVNGGCLIKSNEYFFEPECEIYVPSAFSPDNNGVNDKACVYSDCLESMNFKIFNRWGEQIYQTKEQTNCWDGHYKGTKANTGVYGWTLEATRKSGTKINKTGNITLIR